MIRVVAVLLASGVVAGCSWKRVPDIMDPALRPQADPERTRHLFEYVDALPDAPLKAQLKGRIAFLDAVTLYSATWSTQIDEIRDHNSSNYKALGFLTLGAGLLATGGRRVCHVQRAIASYLSGHCRRGRICGFAPRRIPKYLRQ
jgi:hypothetical protein